MAVILAITILGTGLIGSYTTVPAAEFSAGAIAAGETLEWITAALAGAGISISVKELLKPRQAEIEKDIGKHIDWDNYDWGDALDSPAAQDQIDELDKTINKLYGNASAKWKEMYEKSLSPTPTPETSPDKPDPSPPVTVAPLDPDKVTPPGWDTLRKASMKNGYLALGAATYWCLKKAIGDWWNDLMKNTVSDYDVSKNPYISKACLGYGTVFCPIYSGNSLSCLNEITYWVYVDDMSDIVLNFDPEYLRYFPCRIDKSGTLIPVNYYVYILEKDNGYFDSYSSDVESPDQFGQPVYAGGYTGWLGLKNPYFVNYFNCPIYVNGKISSDYPVKPNKNILWTNPDLKNDYDNNKSPSLPETAPAPAIKIPSLDEIKELQKKGNDSDDEKRPSIIQEFITNHYTNPSTDPNPKPDPDPNPNPDPKPDPDPNPDPNPDPDPDPKPTTAPKPDDTNTDVNPDDYKADLRLVFPFCIPFDLVHLIQAFEAEPEAPVFEFPLDLELENPWTGKKVIDYHHVFKLDMSDYEPVIKIFRIFEIIFFIIGLLMITRQQMIKG